MRLEHSASSLARATEQHDKSLQSEQRLKASYEQQQNKLPALQAALQTAQTARDETAGTVNRARDSIDGAEARVHSAAGRRWIRVQNILQTQQSELACLATELALSAATIG